jgi:hypothetical protein
VQSIPNYSVKTCRLTIDDTPEKAKTEQLLYKKDHSLLRHGTLSDIVQRRSLRGASMRSRIMSWIIGVLVLVASVSMAEAGVPPSAPAYGVRVELTWRGHDELSSDAHTFFYKYTRTLLRDGQVVRTKTWEESIPRDHQ